MKSWVRLQIASNEIPADHRGTAAGVALLGRVSGWLLARIGGAAPFAHGHYQDEFTPLLYGVALAIMLALILGASS